MAWDVLSRDVLSYIQHNYERMSGIFVTCIDPVRLPLPDLCLKGCADNSTAELLCYTYTHTVAWIH